MAAQVEKRLTDRYDDLSARLRDAGDYVVRRPVDVATRSLRAVSQESGVATATFSRLARALDYDSFDALRDATRSNITHRIGGFVDRAQRLWETHGDSSESFFPAHVSACPSNIEQMARLMDQARLSEVVDRLYRSREVLLLGALGSTGLAEYPSYMADFRVHNWHLASRMGASLGSSLSRLGADDVKGWSTDDFGLATEMKSAEQSQALCDNQIDAFVFTVGHPAGSLKEATTTCDVVLLDVTGPAVDTLVDENPYYGKATVPGGMYRGNPDDTQTFGVGATFVSSTDTSEKAVHTVVKAVFGNFDSFRGFHPAFGNLEPETMISRNLSAPLHAVAAKYYKEQGWIE